MSAIENALAHDELDKIARYLISLGILKTDDMTDDEVFEYVMMVVVELQSRLAASEERAKKLTNHLESVMSWIDNWEPNFVDDDEWREEEPGIRAALRGEA